MLSKPLRHVQLMFIIVWVTLACAPTYNWRQIVMEQGSLQLWWPCKPEKADRLVTVTDKSERLLNMLSCRTDDVTFAIGHLPVQQGDDVQQIALSWQTASLATLGQAKEGIALWQVPAQTFLFEVVMSWQVPKAQFNGRDVPVQALIFQYHGHLYLLAVYGQVADSVLTTLLDGVQKGNAL